MPSDGVLCSGAENAFFPTSEEGFTSGQKCPIRKQCQRYTEKPDPKATHIQWFWGLPYRDGQCSCFLPLENK